MIMVGGALVYHGGGCQLGPRCNVISLGLGLFSKLNEMSNHGVILYLGIMILRRERHVIDWSLVKSLPWLPVLSSVGVAGALRCAWVG